MLSGAANHAAIGSSRLLYIANRPGAVVLKTEDDFRIEAENERMAKLGYIGFRPGSVAEPNHGHALFDACGVPERAAVQRELKATESAIITSVVSVGREDAERLGLSTKQDWERLLRSQWNRYIESLGIMQPQDVRWVAAYHVNQANNLHVHLFTWDASGHFNSLLPKQRMARANDELRAAVMKPQRDELSLARTQARDELVAAVRAIRLDEKQRKAVLAALPPEGSLKYGRMSKFHPDGCVAVDRCVADAILSSDSLRAARESYKRAVAGHAALKGLEGAALEAYTAAAESDLRTRLGNALVANVRGCEAPDPEQRDAALRPGKDVVKEDATMVFAEGEKISPDCGFGFEEGPKERLVTARLAEEASSCLSSAEQQKVFDGIRGASEGRIEELARCAGELGRVPILQSDIQGICKSVAGNARGVAALVDQIDASGKGDVGDEMGRRAIGLAFEIAKVLSLALRCAPARPAQAAVLRNAMKQADYL